MLKKMATRAKIRNILKCYLSPPKQMTQFQKTFTGVNLSSFSTKIAKTVLHG